jgi:hypothetical protein
LPGEAPVVLREVTAALAAWDFYLAGGTALALHLGHRVSQDLDFFSSSFAAPDALAADLDRAIPELQVGLVDRRTLYATVRGVQLSFFGYEYPLLESPVPAEEGMPPIAAVADIAAMKLSAIASRGSRKDFVDLWCIVRTGRALRELLGLFSRKFRTRDIGHLVRSLTYFDDAEAEPPLRLLVDAPWHCVKEDLVTWVAELLEGD